MLYSTAYTTYILVYRLFFFGTTIANQYEIPFILSLVCHLLLHLIPAFCNLFHWIILIIPQKQFVHVRHACCLYVAKLQIILWLHAACSSVHDIFSDRDDYGRRRSDEASARSPDAPVNSDQ